jgi:hypothetical protein
MGTSATGLGTPADGGGDMSIHGTEQQPKTPPSCNLDVEHDDAPLRFRNLNDILGPGSPLERVVREVLDHLFMVAREKPNSFYQAEKEASWRHMQWQRKSNPLKITSFES